MSIGQGTHLPLVDSIASLRLATISFSSEFEMDGRKIRQCNKTEHAHTALELCLIQKRVVAHEKSELTTSHANTTLKA